MKGRHLHDMTANQKILLAVCASILSAAARGATPALAAAAAPSEAPGPVLTPGPVVTPADPWADAIAAFAQADREDPRSGGVVFVGSSSFRLWEDLEQRFQTHAALNRGFGGSTLADCVRHLDRLVLPHKPRVVVVYAGDNDLAAGRTPQQVFDDFVALSTRIHQRLPKTEIAFVSIKPSPARADLLDRIRETNTRVRDHIAQHGRFLRYVDVFSPMLDAQGRPRAELFSQDALHLNADGYALWTSLISPVLLLDEQPSMVRSEAQPTTGARRGGSSLRAPD
jgi:lysophospholipase L1-like esterase